MFITNKKRRIQHVVAQPGDDFSICHRPVYDYPREILVGDHKQMDICKDCRRRTVVFLSSALDVAKGA